MDESEHENKFPDKSPITVAVIMLHHFINVKIGSDQQLQQKYNLI